MFTQFLKHSVSLQGAGLLAYFQMRGFDTRARWLSVDYLELQNKFKVPRKRIAECVLWLYESGLIDRKYMDEDDERQDDAGGKPVGKLYISLTIPPYKVLHEYDTEVTPKEKEYQIFNFSLRKEHLVTYLRLKDWKEKHPGEDCSPEVLASLKAGLSFGDLTSTSTSPTTTVS